MNRIAVLALLGLLGCGPSVSKYTVQARLGGPSVNAIHEWERFGNRFDQPGIRRLVPSVAQLNRFADAAGWTKYTDKQACFAVISFQRKSLQFADNVQNVHDDVVDWGSSKHELLTGSGVMLLPAGPPDIKTGEEIVVRYESLDTATGRWIPAQERFDRSAAEVCFDTPTPLAREAWVRWAYTLPNNQRSEFTFQIQAPH